MRSSPANCSGLDAGACLDATNWRPADLGYFRGGGYSSDFLTEGAMPVTMTRLNLVKGTGPFKDVYSVMANWGANHGAVCYGCRGLVGADFISLASMRAS
jgi:L-fucose isomerase